MSSKIVIFLLLVAALLFGTLAGVQIAQDDLSSLFGAPPRQTGDELYVFNLHEAARINITSGSGETAVFKKAGGAWFMSAPVLDRADFRDLQRILFFSRHLRIEDVLRREDTSLEETGMREVGMRPGQFKIKLFDKSGRILAEYRLGRRTGWHRQDEKSGDTSQTFFIRPNERAQKDYIYVCSTPDALRPNVREILDHGLDKLRDHRPFLFDARTLARVEIQNKGGNVVLGRKAMGHPWQITKPLSARTETKAVEALLKGLYQLEATAVHEPGSVTIPNSTSSAEVLEVSLHFFEPGGGILPSPITLTVEPPASETANSVYAKVSDRPGTIFELPLKTAEGGLSIRQLPLEVDDLRSRTLTSLHIQDLRAMAIHDRNRGEPIYLHLGRERVSQRPRWQVTLDSKRVPANELAIAAVFKAVGVEEVVGYATDAGGDLRSYGLAPPQKRLIMRYQVDNEMKDLELHFGRSEDGRFYARQNGSSSITEVSGAAWTAINSASYHWRDTLLLPYSIIDLAAMKIERTARIPFKNAALTLKYDYIDESWTARQYGEDASSRLVVARANKFIHALESTRVLRWLGSTAPEAEKALRDPVFRLSAAFRKVDEDDNLAGMNEVLIEIAPVSRSRFNRNYYGRLTGSPAAGYFLIDQSVEGLAVDLIEE